MPVFFRPFATRRCLVWLLAFLVPLQALALSSLAATGPAHTHLPVAGTRLVLDDFRRSPVRWAAFDTHVASAFGHFHGSVEAERHHHASGDATVVLDGSDLLHAGDADDMSTSLSLGALLGLIYAPLGWLGASTPDVPAAQPRWMPQTHDPAFPERPPNAG